MRTTYVLDTSSLISDPTTYKHYPHSDIIIPIATLNELDNLKKQPGEVGKNARVSIRLIDNISDLGDISVGVLLDNDILLKVDSTYYDANNSMYSGFGSPTYGDTQILICTYDNWLNHPSRDVVLLSNDINLRLKAKARGIGAKGHENNNLSLNELYTGLQTIAHPEAAQDLLEHGFIDPRCFKFNLNPNECICLTDEDGHIMALGRSINKEKVRLIKKSYPWNIASRNKEQSFAIDMLMDKNLDLITLIGEAGGGKSLIALAAGLELVCNRREYDKLVIYRPIQAVGNDIGYMPGTKEEKLAPWYQAIMDSFEVLLSTKNGGDNWKRNLEMFQKKGQVEMEALTYIRGRSIPNAIMLIDEVQNLSKEDAKTILTRAGEGTKIILTGDISQIDNSSLDATNNGLTYIVEKFKDLELSGHITFTKGERSRLATKAAEIL